MVACSPYFRGFAVRVAGDTGKPGRPGCGTARPKALSYPSHADPVANRSLRGTMYPVFPKCIPLMVRLSSVAGLGNHFWAESARLWPAAVRCAFV